MVELRPSTYRSREEDAGPKNWLKTPVISLFDTTDEKCITKLLLYVVTTTELYIIGLWEERKEKKMEQSREFVLFSEDGGKISYYN